MNFNLIDEDEFDEVVHRFSLSIMSLVCFLVFTDWSISKGSNADVSSFSSSLICPKCHDSSFKIFLSTLIFSLLKCKLIIVILELFSHFKHFSNEFPCFKCNILVILNMVINEISNISVCFYCFILFVHFGLRLLL